MPFGTDASNTMTTRTKLHIAGYSTSILIFLNVFSKPLHISDTGQWLMIAGTFIGLGFSFYFIKVLKQERQEQPAPAGEAASTTTDRKQLARKKIIMLMLCGVVAGLFAPLWLPLTGTTLGRGGDFICGLITAAMVCTICGLRLRKL